MKLIPLGQCHFAMVDNKDFERLSQFKWHYVPDAYTGYAARSVRKSKPTTFRMHREILQAPSGIEVDHKNCNGLDNRRRNLRLATDTQQQMNTPKRRAWKGKPTTSRFKGVWWHAQCRKWQAQIQVKGKPMYLGLFVREQDAARAYKRAAKKYFGAFALIP